MLNACASTIGTLIVGVPVVDEKPSPNFNDAVFMATLDTVPENIPVVPTGTPNPIAVAFLVIGTIDQ